MNAETSDAGLLARARSGEDEALTELFRRYGQEVYDTAYRITRSGDDADDVVQDVFIGLPEALRTYDGEGTLGAWLGRVADRAALLRLRTGRRRSKRQQVSATEGRLGYVPAPAVEAKLTLEKALGRMKEDQRLVYVLYEVEGYPHDEIADLLGISKSTSQVRLHRAREYLADRLRGKL